MKNCFKSLLVLLIMAFAGQNAFAQVGSDDWTWGNYSYNKKYPGYVINLTGEKMEGFIQLRGPIENQEKVLFFANENDKKPVMKYSPDDLQAYWVADKYYIAAPYGNLLNPKKKNFILVRSVGRIRKLKHYYYENDAAGLTLEQRRERDMGTSPDLKFDVLLQKGDEKPTGQAKFIMFAKNFSEYINDYPELAAKVKNKEKGYGMLQMDDIIDEYNRWWEENNK